MGIVKTALSYLGNVNYVFGADDIPNGKGDCSSYTQEVYRQHGYTIGRDTESQWLSGGTKIRNISDLKSGDLVFFHSTYASGHVDGVSHVGIYIGDNQFVHCSSGAKNVVVSTLEGYWLNHFLGGLRKTGVNEETETATTTTGTEEDSTENMTIVGNIIKYIFVVGIIVTGIVSLVLSMGIHKQLLKLGGK